MTRNYKRGVKPSWGNAITKPREITDTDRLKIVEAALAQPVPEGQSRSIAGWVKVGAAAGVDRWNAEAIGTLNGDPHPALLQQAAERFKKALS